MTSPEPFNGDRPIPDRDADLLGFEASAKHIATAIAELSSPEGFVVGIEGSWGSGKSSYINLVKQSFRQLPDPPEVVHYLPWLIGSRDALLKELFHDVMEASLRIDVNDSAEERQATIWQKALGRFNPDRLGAREERRKRLRDAFEKFGGHLGSLGKAAELADALGVPYANKAAGALDAAKEGMSKLAQRAPLEKEQRALREELRRLRRKVVVFMDDLDRLEPSEAAEVLRLVRAVADFPNIVYILCYSREILARNLTTALRVENGEGFIEKIVQVTFSIPEPEAFDLRRMFREQLKSAFPEAFLDESIVSRRVQERLATAIDFEGGKSLKTPRHVVRTINSLRLYVRPVLEKVDFADAVWLHLIRARSLSLYDWIEGYMVSVAAIVGGASVGDAGKAASLKRLTTILEGSDQDDGSSLLYRMTIMSMFLPGIEHKLGNGEEEWNVFDDLSANGVADFVATRRLGSPQHYRFYFALSQPSGAIDDLKVQEFIGMCSQDPAAAAESFTQMAVTPRPQGGVVAEALLHRFEGEGLAQVSDGELPGLINAIAAGIDVAARAIGAGDWGKYWIWGDAERLLERALKRLGREERASLVASLFGTGKSLGWLTSIYRAEIFDHGHYGNRQKDEAERLLSPSEFQIAMTKMLQRFRSLVKEDLMRTPSFLNMLYAWWQTAPSDIDQIKKFLSGLMAEDQSFLELLDGMRSWSSINGRVIHPLKKQSISPFLDFDSVAKRLDTLSASQVEPLATRASAIKQSIQLDDD